MNIMPDKKCAPLYFAAHNGHTSTVKLLLDSGALKDLQNIGGNTALHAAAYNGHTSIVRLLVKYGANPVGANDEGETPYDLAKKRNYNEISKILAAAHRKIQGLDQQIQEINQVINQENETMLHEFARRGDMNNARSLIALGAYLSLDQRNSAGKTPGDVAAENGHAETAQLLHELEAKLPSAISQVESGGHATHKLRR